MVIFLDPGRFNARVELETLAAMPDGQGGAEPEWREKAALWARIEPVSERLSEIAGAGHGTVTHRVWMRFRRDIVAGDRLRRGTRIFTVRLVSDPDETARFLVCRCEEESP